MKFIAHASSSKANAYEIVATSGKRLLLDCGLTWAKMQKSLHFNLKDIVGVLIDHSHLDHCKAAADVLKQGIPIYAGWDTLEAVGIDGAAGTTPIALPLDKPLEIGPFHVFAFHVKHDVPNLGFIITDNDTSDQLFFAVDTPNITQRFDCQFQIIAIGCNYDNSILRKRVASGKMNEAGAKRLLHAHMEKSVCKKYIQDFCNLSRCEEIHLLHMSSGNIDKEATRQEFEDELFVPVFIGGQKC